MPAAEQLRKSPHRDVIDAVIQQVSPGSALANLRRMKGGLGCGMHELTVLTTDGKRDKFVIRRYSDQILSEYPDVVERELTFLRLLESTPVNAPRVIYSDSTGSLLGVPGMIQSRVRGRSILSPTNLNNWLDELARGLATLHEIDISNINLEFPGDHDQSARDHHNSAGQIKRTREHAFGKEAWDLCEQHWPTSSEKVLCHTDYWPGNTLWWRGKLSGIVDWEHPGVGDPTTDVSYCRQDLAILFGMDAADRFLDTYESIRGIRLATVPFWNLISGLRAMPDPSMWLTGWVELGRTDMTADLVRKRHNEFVKQAMTKVRSDT